MENVCTIYLCDCKINKLQQSMLIFMLTPLLTNAFMRKKVFLQPFVPNVHETFQLVLKEIISFTNCCCYAENYTFLCLYCSRLKLF